MLKELNKDNFGDCISQVLLNGKDMFVGLLDGETFLVKEDFKASNKALTQMGVLDMNRYQDSIVVSSLDNTIKFFDISDLDLKNTIEAEPMENFKINCFTTDNYSILSCIGLNGKIINYNLESNEIQQTKSINSNYLTSIENLNNINMIIGDNQGNMNIIKNDLSDYHKMKVSYDKLIRNIKTIEDGNKVIVSCDNTFNYLIDVEKGEEIMYFNGHKDIITDIKVESNENCFFSSSCDGTVIYWDKRDKNRHQISYNNNGVAIWALDIDSESKNVILGDEDGFLKKLTY